jgi:hypothetical protein
MGNLKNQENALARNPHVHATLKRAIENTLYVTISAQGLHHVVEPHMIGVKNNSVQVLVWYGTGPCQGCGWMEFNFSDITEIVIIPGTLPYTTPRKVPDLSDWEHFFTAAWAL